MKKTLTFKETLPLSSKTDWTFSGQNAFDYIYKSARALAEALVKKQRQIILPAFSKVLDFVLFYKSIQSGPATIPRPSAK